MSDSVSVVNMVQEVRRLGGFETVDQANAFATDTEIESRLHRNLRRVYNALVKARGANYYRTRMSPAISTVAGTSAYALPAAFMQLLEVSRDLGSGEIEVLEEYTAAERGQWRDQASGDSGMRYQLQAGTIHFLPEPRAGLTIDLYYVPTYSAAASFDGVAGFEEWAIWLTVAELQAKDQADTSYAEKQAMWWESEVQAMARQRDAGRPARVQRTRRARMRGGW